ncbi:MAG: DUF4136 domain-containing protein [Alphaproteobacteria bacterium]|nr:DUF4136 domain-containing protein [Alphaproteobacteria bacterium]
MRSASYLTLVLMFFALLPGRASADATYDPGVDFSKYKTFAWVTDAPMLKSGSAKFRIPTEDVLKTIRATIESQLAAKGFQKADPADFTVAFMVGVRDMALIQHWATTGPTLPGHGSYRWYGSHPIQSRSATHEYKEGELSVDIFDAKTNRAVWHNWAATKVYAQERITPQEVVNEVVTEILDPFPPR